MKHTLLIITALMLVVGCSKPEPINYNTTLVQRDGVFYTKDTNKPYAGPVFSLNKNGQKRSEGTLKDGKKDGKWTLWFSGYIDHNGSDDVGPHYFKQDEGTYKDGKEDGKWTRWHRNGQKEKEVTFKDGKLIDFKEWDENGNVIE